jgi:diguanylate cyclase (GGDEF)-like protein
MWRRWVNKVAQSDTQATESDRRTELGRLAGLLFLAGGLTSLPTGLLIEEVPRGVFAADALAFASGFVCLLLPWRRFSERALHLVAVVATVEVTLAGVVAGAHASVFMPYFFLVALYAAYVFRGRLVVAAHLTLVLAGLLLAALLAQPDNPDALILTVVAGPTLCVGTGVVVWLREGLETSHQRLAAMAAERHAESLTDALTGLANRRRLLVDLDAALLDQTGTHTLALFDLDGFKAYNDTHGHLAGDHLLALLAGRLGAAVPDGGRAYRLGGDEFCVLLPGAGRDADAAVAAACAALASEEEHGGVGCSAGRTRLPYEADTATAALSVADERMYAVKGGERRSTA